MLTSFLIVTNLISLAALAWLFKEYLAKSDLIDYIAEHEPDFLQQVLERCLGDHFQSLSPKYKKRLKAKAEKNDQTKSNYF